MSFGFNKAVVCFGSNGGTGSQRAPGNARGEGSGFGQRNNSFSRMKKGGAPKQSRYNRMRSAAGRRAAGGR